MDKFSLIQVSHYGCCEKCLEKLRKLAISKDGDRYFYLGERNEDGFARLFAMTFEEIKFRNQFHEGILIDHQAESFGFSANTIFITPGGYYPDKDLLRNVIKLYTSSEAGIDITALFSVSIVGSLSAVLTERLLDDLLKEKRLSDMFINRTSSRLYERQDAYLVNGLKPSKWDIPFDEYYKAYLPLIVDRLVAMKEAARGRVAYEKALKEPSAIKVNPTDEYEKVHFNSEKKVLYCLTKDGALKALEGKDLPEDSPYRILF